MPPKLISGVSIALDKGYNEGMSQIAIKNQIYSYEKLGNKGATPILILHGWGRSREEWLRVGRELSVDSEVYLLDLPGFGGSTLPHKVKSFKAYSQLVAQFCQYLKIAKVRIIGHSLGARVGIMLAQPNSGVDVERLVLIDPAGVKSFFVKRIVMLGLSKVFAVVPKRIRRIMVRRLMDEDYQQAGVREGLYRVVVERDLRDYLDSISCEVRLIWGENDLILPLRQVKIYRSRIQNLVVRVVWGAGHDPHLSHYPQLLAILQESIE